MRKILFLSILICSCNQNEKANVEKNIVKEYFPDTKRTIHYEYLIKDGDTVLHGNFTSYGSKGNIVARGHYNNDYIEGDYISYYENGNIESKHIFYKDRKVGESLLYFDNGVLKSYILYNRNSDVVFVVNFNDNGNVLSHEGSLFADWFYSNKNPSNLKVGDTVKYGFILPDIPSVKKEFDVELLNFDNTKIQRSIIDLEPVGVLIKEKATKKSKNIFKAKLTLKFNDSQKTVLKDSLELVFDIK